MTPIRLNIPSSSSPLHDEENQEEYPNHVLLTLKPTSPLSTACSSSTPCEEKKDHGVRDQPQKGADKKEAEEGEEGEEREEGEEEEKEKFLDQADPGFSTSTGSGSTEDDHLIPLRSSPPKMFMDSQGESNEGYNSTKPVVIVHKQEAHDHGDHSGSTDQYCKVDGSTHVMKWMSSKMRVMKKMANYNPDQTPSDPKPTACNELQPQQPAFIPFQSRQRSPPLCDDDNSTTLNSPKIRVCSDCNTTKTPLWRSGPQGPKSLCNACGIRQRKARRAMAAAAAAAANETQLLSVETSNMRSSSSTGASNKAIKEKRSSSSGSTDGFSCRQYKKRCKLGAGPRSRKKIRFDEFTISTLSKSSAAAFHQAVFPQDEEEAAILLMALSCGLVRG